MSRRAFPDLWGIAKTGLTENVSGRGLRRLTWVSVFSEARNARFPGQLVEAVLALFDAPCVALRAAADTCPPRTRAVDSGGTLYSDIERETGWKVLLRFTSVMIGFCNLSHPSPGSRTREHATVSRIALRQGRRESPSSRLVRLESKRNERRVRRTPVTLTSGTLPVRRRDTNSWAVGIAEAASG